jgi:hypothetical protein
VRNQLFLLVSFYLLSACSKISNHFDSFEYDCGEKPNFAAFSYFRFTETDGTVINSRELRITPSQGNFTAKGCYKIEKNQVSSFLVSYPAKNSGLKIFNVPNQATEVIIAPLTNFTYKNIIGKCELPLATQSQIFAMPVDLQGQDIKSYAWSYIIEDERGHELVNSSSVPSDAKQLNIAAYTLKDGKYSLKVFFKQLHSVDQLETKFLCELFIDRRIPIFSVSGLQRVGETTDAPSVVSPGEIIKVMSENEGAPIQFFACLDRSQNSSKQACEPELLVDGNLTAPANGEWKLRGYAQDLAGNRGPIAEKSFQIYNSGSIAAIKSLAQQSQFAVTSGDGVNSVLSALASYEKYKSLESTAERMSVQDEVRRALLETNILPREDLYFSLGRPERRQGLGLTKTQGGLALLTLVQHESTLQSRLDIFKTDGSPMKPVNITEILGETDFPRVQICSDQSTVAVFGQKSMFLLKNGIFSKKLEYGGRLHYSGFGFTDDCRYLYFSAVKDNDWQPSKTEFFALNSTEIYSVEPAINRAYAQLDHSNAVVLIQRNSDYQVVNLVTGQPIPVSLATAPDQISQIYSTASGIVGFYTRDKRFQILSADLTTVRYEYADIDGVYLSSLSDEYILVTTGGHSIKIVDAILGTIRSFVQGNFRNIYYLGADSNYVMFKDYTSDAANVYRRTGGNRTQSFVSTVSNLSNVWISDPGFVYLATPRAIKLLQIQEGFSPKILAPESASIGLGYAGEDKLIFASQNVESFEFGSSTLKSSLVLAENNGKKRAIFPIEKREYWSNIDIPSYALQARNLAVYSDSKGQNWILTIIKQNYLATYRQEDLSRPIMQKQFCSDWVYGLDVSPDRELGVVGCANGFVYVVKLSDLSKVAEYQHVGGYAPLDIGFSSDSNSIYFTDSGQSLSQLKLIQAANGNGEHVASPIWTLELVKSLQNSGLRLAQNSLRSEIATVDLSSIVRRFDEDLKVKGNPINLNQEFSIFANSIHYSPNDKKIYAGLYDGTFSEIEIETNRVFKARVSRTDEGPLQLILSPDGEKMSFSTTDGVRVWGLNMEKTYQVLCDWLRPRIQYFTNASSFQSGLCSTEE